VFGILNKVVEPLHIFLYTYYYGRAIKKWPHLRAEILHGADYSEFLTKYGIHIVKTSQNSSEIHYDWHPDNFVYPITQETELEVNENTEVRREPREGANEP